jgi:hypothetical protein
VERAERHGQRPGSTDEISERHASAPPTPDDETRVSCHQ